VIIILLDAGDDDWPWSRIAVTLNPMQQRLYKPLNTTSRKMTVRGNEHLLDSKSVACGGSD